jgi:RNA-directed DNA polymerase
MDILKSKLSLSLLEQVCQGHNLAAAFARYRSFRGLWAPGMPMSKVAAAPVGPMLELAEQLRSRCYRPLPPFQVPVTKADGSRRQLNVYMLRDRVAQRAALDVLQERTDPAMAPFSFGFRPGRGVAKALQAVQFWLDRGFLWVVDADIERCFDSIPRRLLLDEVTRRVSDVEAARLIADLFGWGPEADGVGIAQGAVISPWLCNIYLWQLDDAMTQAHFPFVRYADDCVALLSGEGVAQQALQLCRDTLDVIHLKLHPLKTRLHFARRPFTFLGQQLAMRPLLPLFTDIGKGELQCY